MANGENEKIKLRAELFIAPAMFVFYKILQNK